MKDGRIEDLRAWGIVTSWTAIRGGEGAEPGDHFPFLRDADAHEVADTAAEDMLFGLVGGEEEIPADEREA